MSGKAVLYIVDDEVDLLESYVEEFASREIQVKLFKSGADLFYELEKKGDYPTAILLDYTLTPRMPGRKVLHRLQQNYLNISVIVYSGQNRQGTLELFGTGAYATITKPIDIQEISDIVNEIFNQQAIFKQMAEDILTITSFDCCLIWQLDKESYAYSIVGWAGKIDRIYRQKANFKHDAVPWIETLRKGNVHYCPDVLNEQLNPKYLDREEAEIRGWHTLITIPLVRDERVLGWIDAYSTKPDYKPLAPEWKHLKLFLKKFAIQASETLRSDALTKQSRMLQEVTQKLNWAAKEEDLFKIILKKALEYTGASVGWIYKLNVLEDVLELGWAIGLPDDRPAPKVKQLDEHLTGRVARSGNYEYLREIYNAADSLPHSRLAVPIKRNEQQVLGVMTIKSQYKNFFTADDIHLVQSLAAAAAVIIDQSKLINHLQAISRLAQKQHSEIEITDYVVAAARDLTHAKVVFWGPSKEDHKRDNWMTVYSSAGTFNEAFMSDLSVPNDPKISANALALKLGEVIIYPDLLQLKPDNPFFHKGKIEELKLRSFMAIPLLGTNKERLGVLSLYSQDKGVFTEEGSHLIKHFVIQTALALQEQRHLIALQDLSNIGANLSVGLPGTEGILKKVAELGKKISRANFTVLYPFDTRNARFFDKDAIVYAGEIHTQIKDQTNKPRLNGMAALTKEYGALVVEEVKGGKSKIKIGLDGRKRSLKKKDREIILRGIQESRFIADEEIGAFISVSLRAGDLKKKHEPLEVGVLYFNYRSPQQFSQDELRVIEIFVRNTANIIYRNRLLDQTQKQNQLLEAVNKAGLAILEQKRGDRQFGDIIKAGVKLLKAKGGKLYRTINGERKDARLEAGFRLPEKVKTGHVVPSGEGMVGQVIKTGTYLWVNDYKNYEHRIEAFVNDFTAVVEVPLKYHDEVIGVLSIFDDHQKHQFGEEDAKSLQKLADQASVAIYNLRLYEELESLYDTGLQVSTNIDLKETAKNILTALEKIVKYKKASVQLVSDIKMKRELLVSSDRREKRRDYDPHLLRPVQEDPLINSILQSQGPKIIPDTTVEAFWERNIRQTKDVRSWACIPLIYTGHIFGLITMDHDQPGFFQKKDYDRLKRFGTQASIAIQNALALKQIQQQKNAFEEVTRNIVSGVSRTELFESLVDAAIKLFEGAHLAEIYILDQYNDVMRRVVYRGKASMHQLPETYKISMGIVGLAYQSRQPILVQNVQDHEHYEEILTTTRSEIVAPIQIDDQIIGFLNIEHPQEGGLGEKDKSLAYALCNLIAIVNLKGNLKLMDHFLSSVNEIVGLREDKENGIESVMSLLAHYALNINQAQKDNKAHINGCTFYLFEDGFFSIQKVKEKFRKTGYKIKARHIALGEGLAGQVAQEGRAIMISDTAKDERVKDNLEIRSMALSPFWSGGRILGVFTLESKQKNAFTQQELNVLEALTLLIESTIYRFEQARKKKEAIRRFFNPYIAGGPIKHPMEFYGRGEILSDLINSLHHNHYFVKGVRRIGKTSLLYQLKYRLEELNDPEYSFFPVLYDLQGVNSSEFYTQFMRRIIQNLDLIDQIKLPEQGQAYSHYDFENDLVIALRVLESRSSGKLIRMIVMLDEIQKMDDFEAIIPEQLRRILLNEDRVKMVMAGVEFFEQQEMKTSPFNIHLEIELTGLEEVAARSLILRPVQGVYSFHEEAIDKIMRMSNLEPMQIQKICRDAVQKMLKRRDSTIKASDVGIN